MTEHEKEVEKAQLAEVLNVCISVFDKEVEASRPDKTTRTLFYHYDGLPEWLGEKELEGHKDGSEYFTLMECLLYSRADRVLYINGERWVMVNYFVSSGEGECPGRHDEAALEECPWSVEEREHEEETGQPPHRGPHTHWCDHCSARYRDGKAVGAHRKVAMVKPEHVDTSDGASEFRRGRCYYCEENLGSPHRYIYLGEGWAEVIYRKDYRQWLLEKEISDVWVQDGTGVEVVEFTDNSGAVIRPKYVDEIVEDFGDGLWEEFGYDVVDDRCTSTYYEDWVKPRCSDDAKQKWLKLQEEAKVSEQSDG